MFQAVQVGPCSRKNDSLKKIVVSRLKSLLDSSPLAVQERLSRLLGLTPVPQSSLKANVRAQPRVFRVGMKLKVRPKNSECPLSLL